MYRLCLLAGADAATLACDRPDFRALGGLGSPSRWIRDAGIDVAATQLGGAVVWLAACWLAVGLALAVAARAPGAVGAVATRASRAVLPTMLRRVLAGAAGASVALAPVSALADPAPPVWPTTGPAVTADPQLPATPAVPVTPAAAAPPATRPVPALTVTVQPGDSLWLIAARGLGTAASPSRTAEAWPRWYAANRATVGADPSLIHPGQQLTAPPDPEVNP